MKKNFLLIACIIALVLGFSSCGGEKHEEETKMIPASAVTISGEHSDFLEINADSVKIMLVNTDAKEDKWTVRALIPFENTNAWEDEWDDMYKLDQLYPKFAFVDANGSEVGRDLSINDNIDKLYTLFKSKTEGKSENILVKVQFENLYSGYEENKNTFDKIAGIDISNMTLEVRHSYKTGSSKSNSSSRSSSDYDLDDAIDAAQKSLELTKEAMDMYKDLDN